MIIEGIVFGAMALLLIASVIGGRFRRAWLGATICGSLMAACAGAGVLLGAGVWEWRSGFELGGESVHLLLDEVSALFLCLIGWIGAAGACYSNGYWTDRDHPRAAPEGRLEWSAFVLSMVCLVLIANGLHFLILWEIFAIIAYFLLTLDRRKSVVRKAGWLYLVCSHAGTMALFAFFAIWADKTGSWDLGPLTDRPDLGYLYWLAIFGFGVKAGLFGLHIWLPSAHANAPSHVSAIMSGVAIKMGIYGLVRFGSWLDVPLSASWFIVSIGVISAILGVVFALGQHDLKRLLAYHSVENIGIILMGLGFALVAAKFNHPLWGSLALAGGLLHIWNHGLFKSLLFLGAGSVLHATGTREMSRLGGLWKKMPWTAALFGLGAAAISGLPPLNGFVSEWFIYLGVFDALNASFTAGSVLTIIALAVTGALAVACFIKVCGVVFLGAPRSSLVEKAHEADWWMRVSMIVLASCCFLIGLFPGLVWPLIARVVIAWQGSASGGLIVPPSIESLSYINIFLLLLTLLIFGAFVWRLKRVNVTRSATWGCGYAAANPRCQYTAASFAATITSWFSWILLPHKKDQRPKNELFPQHASYEEHTPETVLEYVITPVADLLLWITKHARRLQHGRVQSYLLYMLLGLVVLAAIILCGGSR